MMWWIIGILIFLLVWTIASIGFTIANLGNKHGGPSPWWEWVFVAPALALAYIMGKCLHRKQ